MLCQKFPCRHGSWLTKNLPHDANATPENPHKNRLQHATLAKKNMSNFTRSHHQRTSQSACSSPNRTTHTHAPIYIYQDSASNKYPFHDNNTSTQEFNWTDHNEQAWQAIVPIVAINPQHPPSLGTTAKPSRSTSFCSTAEPTHMQDLQHAHTHCLENAVIGCKQASHLQNAVQYIGWNRSKPCLNKQVQLRAGKTRLTMLHSKP